MARFEPNRPIATREPKIEVDAGLPPGRHRFRLEVVDDSGNRSAPDTVVIEIQRGAAEPARPLTPVTPARPVSPAAPVAPLVPGRPVRPR